MANIFNEVDEDIRKERYKKLWSSYGKYLIGLIISIILIFSINQYLVSKNIAEMRTYENGVGETFSCGSAALAVTSLCIKNKFKTVSPGGELNFNNKNNANIEMMGPAKYIYSGNIDV